MNSSAFQNNRYFVLRHGQSVGNTKGLVVSSRSNGLNDFGLTENGRAGVAKSISSALENGIFQGKRILITSPFLRTVETARIASKYLGCRVRVDHRLRERFFGELELSANTNYSRIWQLDSENPEHHFEGVESVKHVRDRFHNLLVDTERRFKNYNIIFCTHGDVASVIFCEFFGYPLNQHHLRGQIEPAEIKVLA